MSRTHTLDTLSEIIMPNGRIMRKLDFLGTICVYGRHYFNVWRRYNNVYEIVIEDFSGDFHFHKDYTIRESIQKVLCLSDEQIRGLYTIDAISFKHRADVSDDVTSMRWTEIEHRWYALDLNVGGILHDFHRIQTDNDEKEDVEPQSSLRITTNVPYNHITNRNLLFEPIATPIRLTDRFTDDFTVLRNGTKIAKPRH
jgi:hypothetical protein